ncbi:MAG: hypothetical protein GEU79_18665 [Acidimicrobiia bacterium]|nr:hypothetical protein [Acidimicrobiia bacterium]
MLEPDAWKAGTSGSEGASAQQRAGATRLVGLLSRGMTTRDIQAHIAEVYQVDISAELVSKITDSVLPELREWQQRPLDVMYPILYLDAIVVKVRTDGQVRNRPVYIALGIDLDGRKHVLGLWLGSGDEGAKYWLGVLNELKNRGVKDVLIVCCDGLTGLGDAIEAVWEKAKVQTSLVHHGATRDGRACHPYRWERASADRPSRSRRRPVPPAGDGPGAAIRSRAMSAVTSDGGACWVRVIENQGGSLWECSLESTGVASTTSWLSSTTTAAPYPMRGSVMMLRASPNSSLSSMGTVPVWREWLSNGPTAYWSKPFNTSG